MEGNKTPKDSGLFTSGKAWPKFSSYALEKDDRGNIFVIPSFDSHLEHYRPVEDKPIQLLEAFVKTGKFLEAAKTLEEKASHILSFCNRYGLLGLFWRHLAGVWPVASLTAGEGVRHDPMILADEPIPLTRHERWLRSYGENVEYMEMVWSDPIQMLNEYLKLQEISGQKGFDIFATPYKDRIESYCVHPIWLCLRVTSGEGSSFGLKFDYQFNSLLDAVVLIEMLMFVGQTDRKLRICKECGLPGVALRDSWKYHDRCLNRVKQRTFKRNLKRKQKQKNLLKKKKTVTPRGANKQKRIRR